MDVSSLFGALTGSGGPKIEIRLDAYDKYVNNVSNSGTSGGIIPMDHYPTWRLHKNPFWRVKHPQGGDQFKIQLPQQQPPELVNEQQQQQQYQQPQYLQQPQQQQQYQQPQYLPQQQQQQQFPQMQQQQQQIQQQQQQHQVFAYEASEDVGGRVSIRVPYGKKIEHLGIKIQFIGRIDMGNGVHEGRPHYDFVSLSKQLSPPGVLFNTTTTFPFSFRNMEKEYETYKGRNISVRYFVRVALERKFLPPITKEHDVWIQTIGSEPLSNDPIKMEVGIEDCLHIEFEYERRSFHLQDTILGKIHFMLVQIKIKHMELAVIRRETTGDGVAANDATGTQNQQQQPNNQQQQQGGSSSNPSVPPVDVNNIVTETQTLIKYEIMDGAPVKGEMIPVKLCLRGIPGDLTPTYPSINNILSVRYFINLVLVDEEDRRYFKQQEIFLWRKQLG